MSGTTTPAPARGLAVAVLMFASFMDLIDATIVNVALPSMRDDLPASPAQLEWIVTAYLLAFAVLLITGGRLGDILGRRRLFLAGVAGFTLCSLAAALAPDATVLIGARAGQGAFAAMMVPQLLSTIQVLFPPRQRAAVFGAVGGISGLAAVAGPLLGGWLVTSDYFGFGWRMIFLINVPVGALLIAAALRFVPESTSPRPPRLDWSGVLLATGALFAITFALVEGRGHDWPGWIWGMLAGGVALLVVFCGYEAWRERRDGAALLPMHLFRNRGYSAGLVTQLLFQGSMVGYVLAFSLYLQTGLGFSAIRAGLTLLSFSLGAFVGIGISIPLGTRLGKIVMFAGAVCQAIGIWWIARIIAAQDLALTGGQLAPALLLCGIGLGLLVVPLIDVALATVDTRDAGSASGAYSTVQQIGAALGVAVIGVVFFHAVGPTFSPHSLQDGVLAASRASILGYVLCATATLLLPSRAAVRQRVAERERLLALES